VLIGAVTLLVVVIAVFLAYNANNGLPFVPTLEAKVEVPNASRLVVGNEVREGGTRVGQVTAVDPVKLSNGRTGASLTVKLDKTVAPVPADSTVVIRSKSALGLKYLALVRGTSKQNLPDGGILRAGREALPVEFDTFFDAFDAPTRANVQRNLRTFGDGFAGRGADLNEALADLPGLLGALPPVMRNLADPQTGLREAIAGMADTMRLLSPVAGDFANGLARAGDTFDALSADPGALRDFISAQPPAYRSIRASLPGVRPTLRRLASISDEVRGTARELRAGAGAIDAALRTGRRTLPATVGFSKDLRGSLDALGGLARNPTTDLGLQSLSSAFQTLTPTLRWVGPHITVCNYWTYFWTYLADNMAEEDGTTGTLQRVLLKFSPPSQKNAFGSFGATAPVQATGKISAVERAIFGDEAELHAQPFGRAVDEHGNADCEAGQRGYPAKVISGTDLYGALDPRTPGNQGPTFTGLPKVPEGQTFSAEPTGSAPAVVNP
jgi:virulence factor Mce-like protein